VGPMLTDKVKLDAGGCVGVPPPTLPLLLVLPAPALIFGVKQPSKTYTSFTMTVQLSTHTGLVPLTAKLNGSPTPPLAPPRNIPLAAVPGVSAPVVALTAKGTTFPWSSKANTNSPCGSAVTAIGPPGLFETRTPPFSVSPPEESML